MNWDQISGRWKQLKGDAQVKWGKITDDEWDQLEGNREKLVGLIQERYGAARDQVEKDVDTWGSRL